MKATYIAFEGIDGSGKTKQIQLLESYLYSKNKNVLLTRELGSPHDEACSRLREFHLCSKLKMDDLAAQYLLSASSIQHCESVIKPNIHKYDYILSDRSLESNLCYGYALNFGKSLIDQIFLEDRRRIFPDIIIYLDIDPKIAEQRTKKRKQEYTLTDRIESKGLEFQSSVRESYLERAQSKSNYKIIDVSKLSIEDTHKAILGVLSL